MGELGILLIRLVKVLLAWGKVGDLHVDVCELGADVGVLIVINLVLSSGMQRKPNF